MKGINEKKAVEVRERTKRLVEDKYGEEFVERKRYELCSNCLRKKNENDCIHGLFPVTVNKDDCPYFVRMSVDVV
ncbi:MAG: hypothetical protein PHQ86_09630 [Dehalococcoidales bacterium]|nr:hypothetical protein [Dehalococcoidales bacterium]